MNGRQSQAAPMTPVMAAPLSLYDRLAGWAPAVVAAATPLVFFLPMTSPSQQAYFFAMATLAMTAALGTAWVAGWRAAPSRLTLPVALALGLGLSACVSIGLSGQWALGLRSALLPATGLLFFGLLAGHPARRATLGRLTLALAIVAVLSSACGVCQFFGVGLLKPVDAIQKNDVIATFGHPDFLGSVLSPMLFLTALVGLGWRRRWARIATLACLAPIVACLLMARARAACLGAACGAVVWIVARVACAAPAPPRRRAIGWALGALACLACMGVTWAVAAPERWRPPAIAGRLLAGNEVKSRMYYWAAAIDMGRERPLFGVGVGMFDARFWPWVLAHQSSPMGAYYRDFMPSIVRRTAQHAHDEYLEIFAEQGYVGLTLFLALLLFFVEQGALACVRCPDRAEQARRCCVLAALAATLIDAAFGFPWRLPTSLAVLATILGWLYDFIYPLAEKPEA
jgi:O-antigen ligase